MTRFTRVTIAGVLLALMLAALALFLQNMLLRDDLRDLRQANYALIRRLATHTAEYQAFVARFPKAVELRSDGTITLGAVMGDTVTGPHFTCVLQASGVTLFRGELLLKKGTIEGTQRRLTLAEFLEMTKPAASAPAPLPVP